LEKLSAEQKIEASYKPFGDGDSGNKILLTLRDMPPQL
jgi:hypothetical protein